jgi:hypothetical protein
MASRRKVSRVGRKTPNALKQQVFIQQAYLNSLMWTWHLA